MPKVQVGSLKTFIRSFTFGCGVTGTGEGTVCHLTVGQVVQSREIRAQRDCCTAQLLSVKLWFFLWEGNKKSYADFTQNVS